MVDSNVAPPPTPLGRLLIGALSIFGALPFRLRSFIGFALGYVAGSLPTRERRIALGQLRLFFPDETARRVTPRVFANAAREMCESLNLAPICSQPDSFVTCGNWPLIQSWVDDKRPLIVLTAHAGNWDLLAAYAIAKGVPITTIGREARSRPLQDVLAWVRNRYGVSTIWRSDRTGIKRLISLLRDNGTLAALIDQDTKVDSTHVPFFGIPARTPSTLVDLGRKFNARFVYAFLFRTSGSRFELHAAELPQPIDTVESNNTLAEYHRVLEALIRQHPEQWVWFHKRWRTPHNRPTMSSKEYLSWLDSSHTSRIFL